MIGFVFNFFDDSFPFVSMDYILAVIFFPALYWILKEKKLNNTYFDFSSCILPKVLGVIQSW